MRLVALMLIGDPAVVGIAETKLRHVTWSITYRSCLRLPLSRAVMMLLGMTFCTVTTMRFLVPLKGTGATSCVPN